MSHDQVLLDLGHYNSRLEDRLKRGGKEMWEFRNDFHGDGNDGNDNHGIWNDIHEVRDGVHEAPPDIHEIHNLLRQKNLKSSVSVTDPAFGRSINISGPADDLACQDVP